MRFLIAFLVMLGSFIFCFAYIHGQQQKQKQLEERLETFSHIQRPQQRRRTFTKRKVDREALQEKFFVLVRKLSQNWKGVNVRVDYDLKMQQAGWPLLGKEFQMALLLLALAGGLLAGLLMWNPLMGLVGAAGGILLGLVSMNIAIQKRQKAFANQLGDMLTMVSNALRSGFSFMQAIEMVAKEMDDPIGGELGEVIRETRLGTPLDKALEHMSSRVQSSDFNLVVTAVLIQRQVGGNLSQILDTISDTVEDRIRMRREVRALTSQGRASGVVLAALPIGLAAILSFVNPTYLDPLWNEDMGRMAVAGGIILEIIGFYVINRIVNIDI